MKKNYSQRQAVILNRYPSIKEYFEKFCATRRNEIINKMIEEDIDYQVLTQRRADTSQNIFNVLNDCGRPEHFEAYSNAIYAEEVYELDYIYREAFLDAVEVIEQHGLQ